MIPVDGSNDNVQSERSSIDSVHIPNCMSPLLDIVLWSIPRIVESRNNQQEPGNYGQDLVGQY